MNQKQNPTDQNDPVIIALNKAQAEQMARHLADPATAECARNFAIHAARAKAEQERLQAEHEAKREANRLLFESAQRGGK